MQPCNGNDTLLPVDGWTDLVSAQRFAASIQWFLIDLFSQQTVVSSFMYRALNHLRLGLEDRNLDNAWRSVNRRAFSIVIVQLVHDLWITLHHWEEGAMKMPMFYMANGSLLQIEGAAPFTSRHIDGIDASLLSWVKKMAYRFPI